MFDSVPTGASPPSINFINGDQLVRVQFGMRATPHARNDVLPRFAAEAKPNKRTFVFLLAIAACEKDDEYLRWNWLMGSQEWVFDGCPDEQRNQLTLQRTVGYFYSGRPKERQKDSFSEPDLVIGNHGQYCFAQSVESELPQQWADPLLQWARLHTLASILKNLRNRRQAEATPRSDESPEHQRSCAPQRVRSDERLGQKRSRLSRFHKVPRLGDIAEEMAHWDELDISPALWLRHLYVHIRATDQDTYHRAAVLAGYLWSRIGNPSILCGNDDGELYESPEPLLELVARQRDCWGAPACWILGKLCTQHPSDNPDVAVIRARDARSWFSKVTETELKETVFLPGLRNEQTPVCEGRFRAILDPPTRMVPVPNRYRGTTALAIAVMESNPSERESLLNEVQAYVRKLVDNVDAQDPYTSTNLELLRVQTTTIRDRLAGRGGSVDAHLKILSEIANANVGLPKKAEWVANCHAGIACRHVTDSQGAHDALAHVLKWTAACLRASGGGTSAFRTDAIYRIAAKQDPSGEFRRALDSLLVGYEMRQRSSADRYAFPNPAPNQD